MRSPECKSSQHRCCGGQANRGTRDRPRWDSCSCGCHQKRKSLRSPITGTVRRWVRDRDGGRCMARISPNCSGRGDHAHHIRLRSQGGDDEMGNLVSVCGHPGGCHEYIHANPLLARARGLLMFTGDELSR